METKENSYEKAFKFFAKELGCNYKIKKEEGLNTYLVKCEDKCYRISELNDLRDECEDLLTSTLANEIPIEIWIELAGDIHKDLNFQNSVFTLMADNEETWNILSEAFDKNSESAEIFWKCLKNLEEIDHYPAAINIAFDYLDSKKTINSLTQKLIEREDFNEMQKGVFKVMEQKDIMKKFYIYSVGCVWW